MPLAYHSTAVGEVFGNVNKTSSVSIRLPATCHWHVAPQRGKLRKCNVAYIALTKMKGMILL